MLTSSFKRCYIHMLYVDVSSVVASDTTFLVPICDLGHNISIVLKKRNAQQDISCTCTMPMMLYAASQS